MENFRVERGVTKPNELHLHFIRELPALRRELVIALGGARHSFFLICIYGLWAEFNPPFHVQVFGLAPPSRKGSNNTHLKKSRKRDAVARKGDGAASHQFVLEPHQQASACWDSGDKSRKSGESKLRRTGGGCRKGKSCGGHEEASWHPLRPSGCSRQDPARLYTVEGNLKC